MFSRIYLIVFYLSVLFTIIGCTKTLDIDVGDFDKRLVINSVIEKEETIKVILSRSESVGENLQDRYIKNAIIELHREGVFVEHLQETILQDSVYNYYTNEIELSTIERSFYESSFLAEEGVSYTLKSSYEGYNDISAETSIPKNIEIKGMDFSSLNTITNYYGENNEFENSYLSGSVYIDIDDPVDEINYYGIDWFVESSGLFSISVYNPETGEYEADTIEETYLNQVYFELVRGESVISDDLDLELEPNLSFFSDEETDIDVRKLRLHVDNLYINGDSEIETKHVFYLRSISEDYYKYEITRIRQNYNEGNFLAEPVFVYSNVENGLGIFAGINESLYVVDVE